MPATAARLLPRLEHRAVPALATTLALIALFSAIAPRSFATIAMAQSIGLNAAITLVITLGTTFILASGGFDLSVGAVLVVGGVVAAKVLSAPVAASLGMPLAVLAGVSAGLALGALNGVLIGYLRLPALIVTLATLGVAKTAAEVLTGGYDIANVPDAVRAAALGSLAGVPVLLWIALVVFGALLFTLRRTRFGQWTLALGSNASAALRVGIPVSIHRVSLYAMSGALAGLAGVMSWCRFGTTTINAFGELSLDAIAMAVLGGTSLYGGRACLLGALVAAFIPTLLRSGLIVVDVASYWQSAITGGVLLVAAALDRRHRRGAA
jgi:ribose transport system permease protein